MLTVARLCGSCRALRAREGQRAMLGCNLLAGHFHSLAPCTIGTGSFCCCSQSCAARNFANVNRTSQKQRRQLTF